MNHCVVELGQLKQIYDGLSSVRNNETVWNNQLDEAQRRIISSKLLDMTHSGVALPKEEQEKFNKLQLEAAGLRSTFNNNVMDSTKSFQYKITDSKDMENVPEGTRALFASRAVAAGHKDATASSGPWIITLDIPSCKSISLFPVL